MFGSRRDKKNRTGPHWIMFTPYALLATPTEIEK